MWRDFFKTQFAYADGYLYFRVVLPDGRVAFTVPFCDDYATGVRLLLNHCRAVDAAPLLCSVSRASYELLTERFQVVSANADRNWFDYLYNSTDLITLSGRKFNGQRNHINRFKRTHPDYIFETLTPANIPDAISFLNRFYDRTDAFGTTEHEEMRKVYELFNAYETYDLPGGLIRTENGIAAISVGEIIGDTLFVHIEKADTTVHGAYQIMVNEFARYYAQDTAYINREEDVGDEGLRKSKLSYHPVCLLEKYVVELKN